LGTKPQRMVTRRKHRIVLDVVVLRKPALVRKRTFRIRYDPETRDEVIGRFVALLKERIRKLKSTANLIGKSCGRRDPICRT
jgi:hypothetical protein